jgi:hypothetical protein
MIVRVVAEIAARVLALVDTRDGTELVTTIAGGMRLADYLPTRTLELAVHTADHPRQLRQHRGPPAHTTLRFPGTGSITSMRICPVNADGVNAMCP